MDKALKRLLAEHLGQELAADGARSVAGGCINEASAISLADGRRAFLKANNAAQVLLAEREGLKALRQVEGLRVPQVLAFFEHEARSYLCLEFLDLDGPANWASLAEKLLALHQTVNSRFGFASDNVIGASPQINTWCESWSDFFWKYRLRFQLQLCAKNGYKLIEATELEDLCGRLLTSHDPDPVLLHGDLWSGNKAFLASGEAVLFDPAVYFGDREAEFALMRMFGGFDQRFYQIYQEALPFPAGNQQRQPLYELYHWLNHVNLFGASYVPQVQASLNQLRR